MPDLAGLSAQERQIVSRFSASEKATFGPEDVIELHRCSRPAANQILSRLARKGWLRRLKQGLYSLVPLSSSTAKPAIENAWLLVMDLFEPAFISGWSAAEHWDLTDQIFNSVSVLTATNQRQVMQVIGDVRFRTRTVTKARFFGARTVWFGSNAVQIADPGRMVIDILDLPRFGGGGRHTLDIIDHYWKSDLHDADRLLEYANRYRRGSVFKRLGFIAEEMKAPVSREWIQVCRTNLSSGISKLDPDGPARGRVISKWNLRVNIPT